MRASASRGRGTRGRGHGRGRGRSAAEPQLATAISKRGASSSAKIKQPIIMIRNLTLIEGPRHARRPSAIAKRAEKRRSSDVLIADEFSCSHESWASPEAMPAEKSEEDGGWLPGPIVRPLPVFKGPKPGPTNPLLNAQSTEVEIMNELLTTEFKMKCREYTIAHAHAHRARHTLSLRNSIEYAFGSQEHSIFADTAAGRRRFFMLIDAWLAAKLRVAHLKLEVAAGSLWGRLDDAAWLHDEQLCSVLTFAQFQWCNRHMSFAPVTDDEGSDEGSDAEDEVGESQESDESEGEEEAEEVDEGGSEEHEAPRSQSMHDTFRRRRELTDIANAAFAAAYNPYQHLGLDEAVRPTKHWEKVRIRFKAAVHSGTLVDMLNDCKTNYCLWFEEQTWLSRATHGDDVRTVTARIKRAAACLVQKQKDGATGRSTANYCISLDRGYGNIRAQHALWDDMGVYSNAMIMANRVGLPREFIGQIAKDLADCPQGCTHKDGIAGCRKFNWTVVNKPPFELSLWQDSQLVLCYGNFFSCSRAGLLSRGAHGSKESYSVWAPENLWHYSIEGRSATDSADQARKKLCLGERRITRAGHKGIAFVFDIAFTNGACLQRLLQPESTPRAQLDRKFTKVLFCQRWANSILALTAQEAPFRQQHKNTSICTPSSSVSPSVLSAPASKTANSSKGIAQNHELARMYMKSQVELEEGEKKKRGRPKKIKAAKHLDHRRGLCGEFNDEGEFVVCGRRPRRSSYFCKQCKRYFHLPCYFKAHYATLMK